MPLTPRLRPLPRAAAAGTVVALVALGLAGCGSSRSTEAFCSELHSGNDTMKASYQSAGNSTGGQVAMILANLSEYNSMIHKLDDTAPDEIHTDMDQATKAWDAQSSQMSQAAGHPLGAIAGALMMGLMNAASDQAVDRFAQAHCGLSVFGTVSTGTTAAAAGTPTDTPTTSTTTPDPPGTITLTNGSAPSSFIHVPGFIGLDTPGGVDGHTTMSTQGDNGSEFAILDDRTFNVLHVFQTQDSSCAWALGGGPDNQGIILTPRYETTPAAGLAPETHKVLMHAIDASSGKDLWQVTIPGQAADQGASCAVQHPGVQGVPTITFTSDGRYATDGSGLYDLKAGTVRAMPGLGALGNWLVSQPQDQSNPTAPWPVIDPATGKQVGALPYAPMSDTWAHYPAQQSAGRTWSIGGQDVVAGMWQDPNQNTHMTAYALPTGKQVWDTTLGPGSFGSGNTFSGIDPKTGTLLIDATAVDDATGKVLWSFSSDKISTVCGADGGSVYVVAATLTTLDARTGKQTSFDQRTTCPAGVRDGAVEMDPANGSVSFSVFTPGTVQPDTSSTDTTPTDTASPSGT